MDFINDFNAHDLLTLIDSIKLKISNMEYKDILDEVTKLHKSGEKMKSTCISLNEKLKQSEDREVQYLLEIKEFLVSEAVLNQNNAYLKNKVAVLNDKLESVKYYLSATNIGFQLKELYSELNNAFVILNDKKEYASHFYKTMGMELEEPYWRIKLVSEKMFKLVESLKFNEKDKNIESYFNASILKKINHLVEKDMLYRTSYRHLTRIEPLRTTVINESSTRTSNYSYSNGLNNSTDNNNSNNNSNDNLNNNNTNNDTNNNNYDNNGSSGGSNGSNDTNDRNNIRLSTEI
jgi:hypothetical protein